MASLAPSPKGIAFALLYFLFAQCKAQHTLRGLTEKINNIESSLTSTRIELLSTLERTKNDVEATTESRIAELAMKLGLVPNRLSSSSLPLTIQQVVSDLRSCNIDIEFEVSLLSFDELKSELIATLNGVASKLLSTLAEFERGKNSLFTEHERKIDDLTNKFLESSADHCPEPFFKLNSECFYHNRRAMSVQQAELHCGLLGGRLAEPDNLIHLVYTLRKNFSGYSGVWMWVGGRKDTSSHTWSWSSGKPVFHWDKEERQPNNRENENCLMIGLGPTSPVYDYYCNEAYGSLCEY